MIVFPSDGALPSSVATSSSLISVIGGATILPATTAPATRSSDLLDMSTAKFTPATLREASASVSATYRVVSADFHAGGSAQLSCDLVVDGASTPPGDGGVGGEFGFAEDG